MHGGPDKAIYVYSDDHYPWWTGELRPDEPYGLGAFGENLTVAGIDETGVCLGDTWRWGTVLLQICQPRYPCFKLAMTTDQPDIIKRFSNPGAADGICAYSSRAPGSWPVQLSWSTRTRQVLQFGKPPWLPTGKESPSVCLRSLRTRLWRLGGQRCFVISQLRRPEYRAR